MCEQNACSKDGATIIVSAISKDSHARSHQSKNIEPCGLQSCRDGFVSTLVLSQPYVTANKGKSWSSWFGLSDTGFGRDFIIPVSRQLVSLFGIVLSSC